MPKVKYEFDLEYGNDDIYRHETFSNAEKYRAALEDIADKVRTRRKYHGADILERLFWKILNDHGVEL